MKRNESPTFVAVTTSLRTTIYLLVSIAVFWIIAINRSPNVLRPLSMLLRTGYTLIIPITFLVLYLAFRIKGWLGNLLSLLLVLSIFALALAGAWATGKTESGLLSGVIPMFDSAHYYGDSLRLLAGHEFTDFSTRRPLFAAFFAFLLWVTKHNLLNALTFLTLFVSLACYLLAIEIKRSHGPVIAIFVLLIVFVYYRYHSGVVRTENLGILFGVLGTALIWRSITISHRIYFIAGIFLTSLGIIARAGAFFILPLLAFWGAFLFKQEGKIFSWQFLLEGVLAMVAAFLINGLIEKSFGTSDAIPFGNFSYSLYGLASGGNSWAYVLKIYPEADQHEIYRMAFKLILEQPNLLAKGIAYNYSTFFSNTNYGLFSYMGGEGKASSTISYWGLLFLSMLGIVNWFRHRDDPYLSFIMISTIGLLLSAPFLPPTDAFRFRAYATSVVILALLPSMGLHSILTRLKMDRLNQKGMTQTNDTSLAIFSAFVLTIVVVGPFVSQGTDTLPTLRPSKCETDRTSLIVRYDPGTMVHLVPQTTQLLDWAPTFHIGTLRNNIHDFPNFDFMDWALEKVDPDTTMFFSLDYRSFKSALILVKSDSLPTPPALLELCGQWEESPEIEQFNIFYPSSVISLAQE